MIGMGKRAGALTAAVILCATGVARAGTEWFASPKLDVGSGYTSNRFQDPGEEGSVYWTARPALEVNGFVGDDVELWAEFGYRHTAYLAPGFGESGDLAAEGGVRFYRNGWGWGAGARLGAYQDDAVPGDDAGWAGVEVSGYRNLGEAVSLSASAAWDGTWYDTRRADDGAAQSDRFLQVRAGPNWSPTREWAVWAAALWERLESNQAPDRFTGAGVEAGADGSASARVRAGGTVRWLRRAYRNGVDGASAPVATPLFASLWTSWRPAPWCELGLRGSYLDHASTDDTDDYGEWQVETTVQFVYDLAL